ncbi:MAG: AsmA family protein, partial [Methylococcales bacterium]
MRKSLKIPLTIFLALVLVFLVAISIITLIFDPNDYKFEITEAVRKNTGRVLDIEGDLKLQILPKLAITTGKMSLNNPEGFGRQTFAEFDSGFFRIRLIPLLSKQIDIKKIVLNGLKIHLIRTKDGRMNWKRFRGSSSRISGNRPIPLRYKNLQAGRAVLADSPLAMLFALKIDIFDAEVDYDDQITGIKIDVQKLEFIIDRFDFGRGIDFRIQGNLTNFKPLFHERVTISGRIFLNEKLDNFKVEDFVWNSRLEGDFSPAEFKEAELTATAELDLAKHTFSATNLRLTSGQTSLGANLFASRIFEKPTLDGQVSIEQANPRRLMELMGIEYTGKDPTALQTLSGN